MINYGLDINFTWLEPIYVPVFAKSPMCMLWGLPSVLRQAVYSSYVHLPASCWVSRSARDESFCPYQALSRHEHNLGYVPGLLDSQECQSFSKSLIDISFPSFSFKFLLSLSSPAADYLRQLAILNSWSQRSSTRWDLSPVKWRCVLQVGFCKELKG